MKLDKYVEILLVYMKNVLEEKAFSINIAEFNFNFSEIKHYMNSNDEVTPDGEDLIAYKKLSKITDNKIIEQVIAKAINENFIKYRGMSGGNKIQLTESGLRMASAIQINQVSKVKFFFTYFTDKILVPLIVSIITAVSTYYAMSYIKDNEANQELKKIKDEIVWIKQKL